MRTIGRMYLPAHAVTFCPNSTSLTHPCIHKPLAIATHRVQFLPLIAGTLGGLLAARFAPFSSEGEEETHG